MRPKRIQKASINKIIAEYSHHKDKDIIILRIIETVRSTVTISISNPFI